MKVRLYLSYLFLSLFFSASAEAGIELKWIDKLCVEISREVQLCKPNAKWDTQTTEDLGSPIKWVFHKGAANPIIKLVYDFSTSAISTFEYALEEKERLKARGIEVKSMKDRNFGGRNVSLIYGHSPSENLKYLVAMWRTGSKGVKLECTSAPADFPQFEPQFMASIQAFKILKEK